MTPVMPPALLKDAVLTLALTGEVCVDDGWTMTLAASLPFTAELMRLLNTGEEASPAPCRAFRRCCSTRESLIHLPPQVIPGIWRARYYMENNRITFRLFHPSSGSRHSWLQTLLLSKGEKGK